MDPYIDRNRFIGIKEKMMDNDSKLNYNRNKYRTIFEKSNVLIHSELDGFSFSMNLDPNSEDMNPIALLGQLSEN